MSNLMNFRFHRGTLEESMKTLVQVVNDAEALCEYLNEYHESSGLSKVFPYEYKVENLRLREQGADPRIGWSETWLIYFEKFGVQGMVDQMPYGVAEEQIVRNGPQHSLMVIGGYHIDTQGRGVKEPFDKSEAEIAQLIEEGNPGAQYYFTLVNGKPESKFPNALEEYMQGKIGALEVFDKALGKRIRQANECEETLQPGTSPETILGIDPGTGDGYPDMAILKIPEGKVIKDSPAEMLDMDDDAYRGVINQYLTDELFDDEKLKVMLPSIKECLLVLLREHKRKIAAGEETIPELEARLRLDENRNLTDLCTVAVNDRIPVVTGDLRGPSDGKIVSEATTGIMPILPTDYSFMERNPEFAASMKAKYYADVEKAGIDPKALADWEPFASANGAEWFEILREYIAAGKNEAALIMIDSIPEHLQGMKEVKKGMVVLPDADTMTEQMVDATRGLHLYYVESTGGVSCENMRTHLNRYAPWSAKYWPEWFKTDNGHLTKAGRSIVAHALTIGAWKDPDARSNYFKEEQKERQHVWDLPRNQYIQLEFKPCVMGEVSEGGGFKVAVPFTWARQLADDSFELVLNRSDMPKEHRKGFKTNCVKVSLKLTENFRAVVFGDIEVNSKYESSTWQVEPKMVSRFGK